ncbi:hypothetical protein [Haloarcula marismortui]|uniref:hypothetical protein n=1 Tax=Haloarcula marismortui TaxID=2238 RepID=UPI001E569E5E|nr:hypothetical protein [Haloarcula sinaiiensis]
MNTRVDECGDVFEQVIFEFGKPLVGVVALTGLVAVLAVPPEAELVRFNGVFVMGE